MKLRNWYRHERNNWWILDGVTDKGLSVHLIFLERKPDTWMIYATNNTANPISWIPMNIKDEEEAKAVALLFL